MDANGNTLEARHRDGGCRVCAPSVRWWDVVVGPGMPVVGAFEAAALADKIRKNGQDHTVKERNG